MFEKQQVLREIIKTGVVAVVRANDPDQAKRIAEACLEGGIKAIEITFTVPGAVKVLEELTKSYSREELVLGAGTILDSETARIAILSGAKYIVSPTFNLSTVRLCNRYGIVCMPGAMTITEVVEILESGADIIKIFPGEMFGPAFVRAIKSPLPQVNLMPTGGITLDNVSEWIKAGACAVGVGSVLTNSAAIGDFRTITDISKSFVEKIKQARYELEESK